MKSKSFKQYFWWLLFSISIIFNLLFYLIEINPLVVNKFHKEKYLTNIDATNHKRLIVNAALHMNSTRQTIMKFEAHKTFFEEVRMLRNSRQENIFKEYNYLKAFLLHGLLEYGIKRHDTVVISQMHDIASNYINTDGKLAFDLNKVDQAVFGLDFIELEQYSHHKQYRKGIDQIFNFLKNNIDQKENIIKYRKADPHQFVDALGMVCPFLIKYGVIYHDTLAINMANREILYYIKNGLETSSHFPFHAVELDNKIKLGPSTWGRGIGWYAIALAYNLHYTNKSNNPYYKIFENEMDILYRNLKILQYHNCWGQFINGNKSEQVDTSTTALLLLAFNLAGKEKLSDKEIVGIFKQYTTSDGYIDYTSGDTFDINRYSTEFGKSELTQGLILSLYSNATE